MIHLSGLDVRDESNPEGDIEIQYSGLRPGEKLYEELLIGDNVSDTEHPLIMRAKEIELPWSFLQEKLAQIDASSHQFDCVAVRAILLEVVDGYQPTGGICDNTWKTSPVFS
jgi:FlaA1/EpsC-like NDP-sugar epimerase